MSQIYCIQYCIQCQVPKLYQTQYPFFLLIASISDATLLHILRAILLF